MHVFLRLPLPGKKLRPIIQKIDASSTVFPGDICSPSHEKIFSEVDLALFNEKAITYK